MQKKLSEVAAELSGAGATGILSVSVTGDPSLFKLFFRDGEIYHITHGSCSDRECLARLAALTLDATTYMPGAQVTIKAPSLPKTRELIDQFAALGKTVRWEPKPGTNTRPNDAAASSKKAAPRAIEKLRDELVNIIGPVASMVLEQCLEACKLTEQSPLSERDYLRLVHTLADRLPGDQKQEFLAKVGP